MLESDRRSACEQLLHSLFSYSYSYEHQVSELDAFATRMQQEALEWQPLETAPKDGTAFRAYAPELVHADFNPWGSVEAVGDGEGRFIGAVWDGCHDIWRTEFIEPTAWMPLPAPPRASQVGAPADE